MDAQTLPPWLAPKPYYHPDEIAQEQSLRTIKRGIEEHTFEAIFESALEHMSSGQALNILFDSDPRQPHMGRFIRWVYKDEDRKTQYRNAQIVGAEVVAQEVVKISDADDNIEDVSRSTLRINTRKWLLGIWDRDRFGDVKKIEQTVSVDIRDAMDRANERLDRLRTIDAPVRVINGE